MCPFWEFGLVALSCGLVSCALAGALFWAALASFDRRVGRMPETSQSEEAGASPRLVPVGAGCQNEER
jgi:hypothetical protein